MITKNDIAAVKLSPTNKDFAQIWTEIIDVASKISTRWDPVSTNESDPGIVLLKVLVGIADKLNYNIDKNILEAYMPSAAQTESMRTLCEMLGYTMKYYRSAETTITVDYTKYSSKGDTPDNEENPGYALPELGLQLPKFTVFYNDNRDVYYTSVNSTPIFIYNNAHRVKVPCIEGQVVQCESLNGNNVIKFNNLTDNYRYYLPETQIAENGIFIYNAVINAETGELSEGNIPWTRVDNLNISANIERPYKFGFDSARGLPFIEFNSNVSDLLEDGIFIYYTRTSGANGNISANTITQFDAPSLDYWSGYSLEHFTVTNPRPVISGANPESITEAYNNYKKTQGTFDTLITCRDYMNKIYSLMDEDNNPYVSNINVADINTDINNSVTICSCSHGGILYKVKSLGFEVDNSRNSIIEAVSTEVANHYNAIVTNATKTSVKDIPNLNNFELVLYPFSTYTNVSEKTNSIGDLYNKSFKYNEPTINDKDFTTGLTELLSEIKTLAHVFKLPESGDIVSINNYLRLDAIISTVDKVTGNEAQTILNNIKIALANRFNMRNVDFGEEIPYDEILETIETADSRIRLVSLQDPTPRMYTKFAVKLGHNDIVEYFADSETQNDCLSYYPSQEAQDASDSIYNKLVVRNILAGRVPLFNFDTTFETSFDEATYVKRRTIDISKVGTSLKQDLFDAVSALGIINSPGVHPLLKEGQPIVCENEIKVNEDIIVHKNAQFEYKAYYATSTSTELTKEYVEVYEPYDSIFDNVTDIEIETEIPEEDGEIGDVTLEDGENIEFTAPNLITTTTYPAYVYYNFLSKERNSVSTASYAEAASLIDAIESNQNEEHKGEAFFKKLWQTAPADGPNPILKEFYLKYSEDGEEAQTSSDGSSWEARKSDLNSYLNSIFRSAYRIGTIAIEKPDTSSFLNALLFAINPIAGLLAAAVSGMLVSGSNGASGTPKYNSFTSTEGVLKYLDDNKDNLKGISVRFFYVPLQESTLNFWRSFLTDDNLGKSLLAKKPEVGDYTVLYRLAGSGNAIGKHILENGTKLLAQEGKYLLEMSYPFSETYIVCKSGSDPASYSIPKDSDYQLRAGEKLFIHYTPSNTSEDGSTTTATPQCLVYEYPTIIRPTGFDLQDSQLQFNRGGISWKKENVGFPGYDGQNLFSLGASEQIEIREYSQVTIDKDTSAEVNIYANFDPAEKFTEDVSSSTGGSTSANGASNSKTKTYVLQDGEYFFYTDQNKASVAYYGSGSEVQLVNLTLPTMNTDADIDNLLANSLNAVPFQTLKLLDGMSITIKENQFFTLVAGDTLKKLKLKNGVSLTGTPTECINTEDSPVTFLRAGDTEETKLPRVDLVDATWKASCKTTLLTSPATVQKIRSTDKIKNTLRITNTVYADDESGTGYASKAEITPEPGNAIAIKTSEIIQSVNGKATFDELDGVSLKVFSEGNSSIANAPVSTMRTGTAVFTKMAIRDLAPTQQGLLTLSASIPNNRLGLFTIIVHEENGFLDGLRTKSGRAIDFPSSGNRVYIEFPANCVGNMQLMNYNCTNQNLDSTNGEITDWWGVDLPIDSAQHAEYEASPATNVLPEYIINAQESIPSDNTYRLYLRNGINCIQIKKSMSFNIKAEANVDRYDAADFNGIIAFDNLKLIDLSTTINQEQLRYRNGTSPTEALLSAIREIDKDYEFYYSLEPELALSIGFNEAARETLDTPHIYFDDNNINRNFVISKIDFDYLERSSTNKQRIKTASGYKDYYSTGGIQIARSSRLS